MMDPIVKTKITESPAVGVTVQAVITPLTVIIR